MAIILVVEDEAPVRRWLQTVLEREGHRVVEAENGAVGLNRFRQYQPDLVITDVYMPEKEGLAVIREIRRRSPATRIIAMSGGGQLGLDVLDMALGLGAAAVLRKPFERLELLAALGS